MEYISCIICGEPVKASKGRVTCSARCARAWEARIDIALHALNRPGATTCTLRKMPDGKPAAIVCRSASPEACEKCGWNPAEEKRRIRKARREHGKDKES